MILTRVFPGGPESLDVEDPATRARLLELYALPHPEWLRINLIVTVSGSAGGADGTSETITNPADRRILGVIRELSDVVLIGAESLRREGYVLPRSARLAVVTASGALEGHGIVPPVEAGRLIVLCPPSATARVRESLGEVAAEIVEIAGPHGRIPPSAIVTALRSLGLASIVCEGGPSLVSQFIDADEVDELCLSTSPLLNGGGIPAFGATDHPEVRLTLAQLLVDDASGVYARWFTGAERATPR